MRGMRGQKSSPQDEERCPGPAKSLEGIAEVDIASLEQLLVALCNIGSR